MFRVDDPRSEPRVLQELRQKKMAEDAESDIAIRFDDENDGLAWSLRILLCISVLCGSSNLSTTPFPQR